MPVSSLFKIVSFYSSSCTAGTFKEANRRGEHFLIESNCIPLGSLRRVLTGTGLTATCSHRYWSHGDLFSQVLVSWRHVLTGTGLVATCSHRYWSHGDMFSQVMVSRRPVLTGTCFMVRCSHRYWSHGDLFS